MWVMTKKIKGREYLYLYKSKWENGKPRNKFIKYLGAKNQYTDKKLTKIVREEEDRKA